MNKKVLIPYTTGVEEIEIIAVVDLLRRAGVTTCMASLDGQAVTGRSGITMISDASLSDMLHQQWDMIVLPGGLPNAQLLRDDENIKTIVNRLHKEHKSIAAICAAPTALAAYGITEHMRVTSYPSCQPEMEALQPSSIYVDEAVVEDDFLITSRGPGTAIAFALRLIARLCGEQTADQIRQEIVS